MVNHHVLEARVLNEYVLEGTFESRTDRNRLVIGSFCIKESSKKLIFTENAVTLKINIFFKKQDIKNVHHT